MLKRRFVSEPKGLSQKLCWFSWADLLNWYSSDWIQTIFCTSIKGLACSCCQRNGLYEVFQSEIVCVKASLVSHGFPCHFFAHTSVWWLLFHVVWIFFSPFKKWIGVLCLYPQRVVLWLVVKMNGRPTITPFFVKAFQFAFRLLVLIDKCFQEIQALAVCSSEQPQWNTDIAESKS